MHFKFFRINKSNTDIVHFLFIVIWIVNTNFFLLLPANSTLLAINSNTQKYLEALLCLLSAFICYPYANKILKNDRRLSSFIILGIIITLIISLFSMILYKENIIDTFTAWYYYLEFLYIFPILFIIKQKNGLEFIAKVIINISILYCIVSCLQEFVYLRNGTLFLPGLYKDNYSFRDGYLRLISYNVNQIAFIFLCSKFWNTKNKKIRNFIYIALEFFAQVYAYHTRSMQIIYLFILAFSYLISHRNNKVIRIIIIVIVAIVGFHLFDINAFLETFSIDSMNGTGLSTLNRLGAISYFWSRFLHNPFFGNGYIRESRMDLRTILHGGSTAYGNSTFYYSDVGIIGVLGKTGILGFLLYLLLIVFMIKVSFKLYRSTIIADYPKTMISTFAFYLLITSFTLIACNPERILTLPLIIGIAYYYYHFSGIYQKSE